VKIMLAALLLAGCSNGLLFPKSGKAPDATQGHESHGGDRLASIFVSKGYRIYAHLLSLDPATAPLAPADIARLRDALESTRVDPVDDTLKDSAGDVVDARVIDDPLYKGRKLIQLDRGRWEEWLGTGADVFRLVFHEYLWVLGFDDANYRISNQLGLFEEPPSGVGAWTTMNPREAPAADDSVAVPIGPRMLVLAANTAGNCSGQVKMTAYDLAANAWSTVKVPDGMTLGAGFGSAVVGDGLMVFGGVCTGASRESIAYRQAAALYVSSSDEWRPVATANAPSGRRQPLMVASDDEVLVWGGLDATGRLATGAVYARKSDTWRAVSTLNAPPPGNYGGAYSGGKMLLWKRDAESCAPTAFTYDPATDVWASMTVKPAPSFGCHWDQAVWTGDAVAFYFDYPQTDGSDPHFATAPSAAGAFWKPETDTWTPIPAVGAPSQRSGASVVWGGDKLVVFGGTDIDGYELNSGAFYVPETGNWTALRWEGAPAARAKNVALWLYDGLLIWGGRSITDQQLKGGAVWRP
jgi:hypothetical protein